MFRRICPDGPHPPYVSEFDVPDSGGVPQVFFADPKDCLELSNILLDVAWYREENDESIARKTGLAHDIVADALRKGKGNEEDVFLIADAIGLVLYGIPCEEDLERGVS